MLKHKIQEIRTSTRVSSFIFQSSSQIQSHSPVSSMSHVLFVFESFKFCIRSHMVSVQDGSLGSSLTLCLCSCSSEMCWGCERGWRHPHPTPTLLGPSQRADRKWEAAPALRPAQAQAQESRQQFQQQPQQHQQQQQCTEGPGSVTINSHSDFQYCAEEEW